MRHGASSSEPTTPISVMALIGLRVESASESPVVRCAGDGVRAGFAYAWRSTVSERVWQSRCRPRRASTTPGAPRRRRCFGWCRIICTGDRRCTTSALRASTARGVRWWRRWPTSSWRAASSSTGSRECAATRARTSICWPSRASAGTSVPDCHAKRLVIWTQWLDTTLLAPVPHRQVVLTLPKRLRASCLFRRRLLGEIARVAARTVTAAIRTLTGERDLAVGIVACLQTHGSRANWHPHLHLLVTDGGFRPDGPFVAWPVHDTARVTEAFRRAVLQLFVRLALFDAAQAAGMLTWPHSGFHVHTAVWVSEDDRAFATRLARYCLRAQSGRAGAVDV